MGGIGIGQKNQKAQLPERSIKPSTCTLEICKVRPRVVSRLRSLSKLEAQQGRQTSPDLSTPLFAFLTLMSMNYELSRG